MPGNPYRRSRVLDGGGKEGGVGGVQQEGGSKVAKRRSRFLKSDSDEEEAAPPRRSWRDELGIEKESTRYCCVLLVILGGFGGPTHYFCSPHRAEQCSNVAAKIDLCYVS